jgi:hypothetical protein
MVNVSSGGGDCGLFSPAWRALCAGAGNWRPDGKFQGAATGCYPRLGAVKLAGASCGIRGRCDSCALEGARGVKREVGKLRGARNVEKERESWSSYACSQVWLPPRGARALARAKCGTDWDWGLEGTEHGRRDPELRNTTTFTIIESIARAKRLALPYYITTTACGLRSPTQYALATATRCLYFRSTSLRPTVYLLPTYV